MVQIRAPDTRKHVPEGLTDIFFIQGSESHMDVYRLMGTSETKLIPEFISAENSTGHTNAYPKQTMMNDVE